MSLYKPMPLHLDTARLQLQPWDESDAEDLCALHSERVNLTRTRAVKMPLTLLIDRGSTYTVLSFEVLPISFHRDCAWVACVGRMINRAAMKGRIATLCAVTAGFDNRLFNESIDIDAGRINIG